MIDRSIFLSRQHAPRVFPCSVYYYVGRVICAITIYYVFIGFFGFFFQHIPLLHMHIDDFLQFRLFVLCSSPPPSLYPSPIWLLLSFTSFRFQYFGYFLVAQVCCSLSACVFSTLFFSFSFERYFHHKSFSWNLNKIYFSSTRYKNNTKSIWKITTIINIIVVGFVVFHSVRSTVFRSPSFILSAWFDHHHAIYTSIDVLALYCDRCVHIQNRWKFSFILESVRVGSVVMSNCISPYVCHAVYFFLHMFVLFQRLLVFFRPSILFAVAYRFGVVSIWFLINFNLYGVGHLVAFYYSMWPTLKP